MSDMEDSLPSGLQTVLVLGALSFLLGAVLAMGLLAVRPVVTLPRQADVSELAPGTVYLIRGERSGSAAWRIQQAGWTDATSDRVVLTEGDLNAWAEQALRLDVEEDGESPTRPWWQPFLLQWENVNFRFDNGQIIIMAEARLPWSGQATAMPYQLSGELQNRRDGVVFIAQRAVLGQAPVGLVPGLSHLVNASLRAMMRQKTGAQWVAQEWENFQFAQIVDGQLILQRQAPEA